MKSRRRLTSLLVTIMLFDVVLAASAFLPVNLTEVSQQGIAGETQSTPTVREAWFGKFIVRVLACVGCGVTAYEPWCDTCRGKNNKRMK